MINQGEKMIKCDINLNSLEAKGVDVKITRIQLMERTAPKQAVKEPAVVENGVVVKETVYESRTVTEWLMEYNVKITNKDGKPVNFPGMTNQTNITWDDKTHPRKFAETHFKALEAVTVK